MDKARIAAANYHYKRYTLEAFLKAAAETGYTSLELWASGPHLHLEDFDNARLTQLRRNIRAMGLAVRCLTPEQYVYPISVSHPDPAYRRRSREFFARHIEAAALLECGMMVVSTGISYLDVPREDAWKWCVENLESLARVAEREGVTLALEAFTRYSTHVLRTASDVAAMIDEIGSARLGAVIDVDVIANSGLESLDEYIPGIGNRLQHVHFVDGNPGGHLIPGDGVLDMPHALAAIEATGYTGLYAMELLDRRYVMEPKAALAAYLAWFA
jgi:Sugar phosphate isomerases/epimerases